jgi:hypothetical protein
MAIISAIHGWSTGLGMGAANSMFCVGSTRWFVACSSTKGGNVRGTSFLSSILLAKAIHRIIFPIIFNFPSLQTESHLFFQSLVDCSTLLGYSAACYIKAQRTSWQAVFWLLQLKLAVNTQISGRLWRLGLPNSALGFALADQQRIRPL